MSDSLSSLTSDRDYLRIAYEFSGTMDPNGAVDADITYPASYYLGAGLPANSASTTFTHNFGYAPIVRPFWSEDGGTTWVNWYEYPNSDFALAPVITTSSAKFVLVRYAGATTGIPVFIRVYEFDSTKSISSDDRIDRIYDTGEVSGSTIVATDKTSFYYNTVSVAHNSPSGIPIWSAQLSLDGTNWYEEGVTIGSGPNTDGGNGYILQVSANATNIIFRIGSTNTSSAVSLFIRYNLELRI
jgi:hypothetical protein